LKIAPLQSVSATPSPNALPSSMTPTDSTRHAASRPGVRAQLRHEGIASGRNANRRRIG
jgi:hypothetical protein